MGRPITALWFVVLAVLGLMHVLKNPAVLAAISPHYALGFIYNHTGVAFVALGAIILCATGAEAQPVSNNAGNAHAANTLIFTRISPAFMLF